MSVIPIPTPAAQLADSLARPEEVLPPVGLHEDVAAHIYHKWNCASQSRLTQLERSPAHLRAYMDTPREPTDAQDFGTAAHYAALEPDLFELRYMRGPVDDRRKKAWLDCVNENPAMDVLRPSDWAACMAIRDAVHEHPAAHLALNHDGPTELSGCWIDEETGVPCKLRIDHLNPALQATVEIKTARDAREDEFSRSIFNYRYYRQGAMYLMGVGVLRPDVDWKHHIIVAVEKEAPYAVNVFRVRDDAIGAGRDELRPLLARYAECFARNEFPAYGTQFTEISLPPYAWRQIDQKLERVG